MAANEDRSEKTIFVGNLDYKTKHTELREFFKRFGRVRRVYLHKDRQSKLAERCAFVTFATKEDAAKALDIPKRRKIFKERVLNIAPSTRKKINDYNWKGSPVSSSLLPADSVWEGERQLTAAEKVGRCEDIMPNILCHLNVEDLLSAEKVCRRWHQLALKIWSLKTSLVFAPTGSLRRVSEHDFNKLVKRCGRNLVKLDTFHISRPLDATTVGLIVKYCKNLKTLRLYDVAFTNKSLVKLTEGLPELRCIELHYCKHFTEKGFAVFFEKSKKLESITISYNMNIIGECFIKLGPNVRKLNLSYCCNIVAEGFMEIAWMCPKLETLNLDACGLLMNDTFVRIYSGCPNIKRLSLKFMEYFIEHQLGLSLLSAMSNLVDLNLSSNDQLTDADLKILGDGCPKLQVLNIASCWDISDYGLTHLAKCVELRSIDVSNLPYITGDTIVTISYKCPLEEVVCNGCLKAETKPFVDLVKSAPFLSYLDVTDCVLITDWLIVEALSVVQRQRNRTGPLLSIVMPGTGASSVTGKSQFWHRFLEIVETRQVNHSLPPEI